jgi:hypothetical protein
MRSKVDTYRRLSWMCAYMERTGDGSAPLIDDALDIIWLAMSADEQRDVNVLLRDDGVIERHIAMGFDGDKADEQQANRIPFVSISDEQLGNKLGDAVKCGKCGQTHAVEYVTENGKPSDLLQFVKCGDDTLLVGVGGRGIK